MSTFQTAIEQERTRLVNARKELVSKQEGILQQIADINLELNAIAAYEAARKGTAPSGDSPRTSTRPASGKRGQILSLLRERTSGLSRAEILEALGVKGDRGAEQSISNALTTLKKQGKITATDDGVYTAS